MPCDEIETRYCRYIEEVVNHRHLDRLTAYLTPDVIVHAPGVAPGRPVPASCSPATSERSQTSTCGSTPCWLWTATC
jgi:hypothetical protein